MPQLHFAETSSHDSISIKRVVDTSSLEEKPGVFQTANTFKIFNDDIENEDFYETVPIENSKITEIAN